MLVLPRIVRVAAAIAIVANHCARAHRAETSHRSAWPPRQPRVSPAQAALDCWTVGSWVEQLDAPPGADPWTWTPSAPCAPPLPRVTADEWCDVHDGVRLLLIGDSLTAQNFWATLRLARHAAARVNASSVRMREREIACDSRPNAAPRIVGCTAVTVCDGRAAVAFVRNDYLVPVRKRLYRPAELLHPLGDALAGWQPTHVLLNRGAHWMADKRFADGLVKALAFVRRLAPRATPLLRSTPAGHPGCAAYTRPVTRPLPLTSPAAHLHHWSSFPRQNRLMRRVAAEHGVLFVDYAAPTALRPDRHKGPGGRDCLHYVDTDAGGPAAASGPLFTWVRLAAAAVALLRSAPQAGPGAPLDSGVAGADYALNVAADVARGWPALVAAGLAEPVAP